MNSLILSVILALATTNIAIAEPLPLLLDTLSDPVSGVINTADLPIGGLVGDLTSGLIGGLGDIVDVGGISGLDNIGGGLLGGVNNLLNGLLSGDLLGNVNNLLGGLLGNSLGGVNNATVENLLSIQNGYTFFENQCKLIEKYLGLFECFMNNWERMLKDSLRFNNLIVDTGKWLGYNITNFKTLYDKGGVQQLTDLFLTGFSKMANSLFEDSNSFRDQFFSENGIIYKLLASSVGPEKATAALNQVLSGSPGLLSTILGRPGVDVSVTSNGGILGLLNNLLLGSTPQIKLVDELPLL